MYSTTRNESSTSELFVAAIVARCVTSSVCTDTPDGFFRRPTAASVALPYVVYASCFVLTLINRHSSPCKVSSTAKTALSESAVSFDMFASCQLAPLGQVRPASGTTIAYCTVVWSIGFDAFPVASQSTLQMNPFDSVSLAVAVPTFA